MIPSYWTVNNTGERGLFTIEEESSAAIEAISIKVVSMCSTEIQYIVIPVSYESLDPWVLPDVVCALRKVNLSLTVGGQTGGSATATH